MNINISFSKIELNFNTKINSCLNNFFLLNTPLFNLVLELPKFSISTSSLAKGFWSSPLLTSFLRSGADQKPLASEDAISINEKRIMEMVKQMLMHLILVVHIVIYLLYTWDPNLCLQHLKRLRSHNSLFLTKIYPSGFSDS